VFEKMVEEKFISHHKMNFCQGGGDQGELGIR
jgi:hypothetical protein